MQIRDRLLVPKFLCSESEYEVVASNESLKDAIRNASDNNRVGVKTEHCEPGKCRTGWMRRRWIWQVDVWCE